MGNSGPVGGCYPNNPLYRKGDGSMEVVLPVGCFGALKIYDGPTGSLRFAAQLGQRTQGSTSIGDLDGDGRLDVVVGSYDGQVWVLEGAVSVYVPLVRR